MKNVLIPLAPGFEEIETITVVDILRRSGARVSTAGIVDGLLKAQEGLNSLRMNLLIILILKNLT